MHELTGTAITRWLNVELPKVQNTRVDLLGEVSDGGLYHRRGAPAHEKCLHGLDLRFRYRTVDIGAIPSWAEARLAGCSAAELEDLSVRLLDAQSRDALLH